jgi:Holliday junction resolvasome RuvABC endonuclease subunit
VTALGIDPGASGGIAALAADGTLLWAVPTPATHRDILDLLQSAWPARAVLEFVRSSPQMGVVSAFSFGAHAGALRMALVAAGIPFDEVTPQKWQAAMQCRTKGDKNVSKRRAQELFPSVKVTHATADALLLAEYGRRIDRRLTAPTEG